MHHGITVNKVQTSQLGQKFHFIFNKRLYVENGIELLSSDVEDQTFSRLRKSMADKTNEKGHRRSL